VDVNKRIVSIQQNVIAGAKMDTQP